MSNYCPLNQANPKPSPAFSPFWTMSLSLSLWPAVGLAQKQELFHFQSNHTDPKNQPVDSPDSRPSVLDSQSFGGEPDLPVGEKHSYPFTLKGNEYLKLVVEQQGIDDAMISTISTLRSTSDAETQKLLDE